MAKTFSRNIKDSLLNKSATTTYLKNLLKAHKLQVNLALFLAICSVLLFITQSALMASLLADWLNDISNNNTPSLALTWQILPWLAACLLLRPILFLAKDQFLLRTSLRIRYQVRQTLLNAIVALGPTRHYFGSDGNLSAKIIEQVDELDGYISKYYVQSYIAIITPLFIVVATFIYSPLSAILLLLTAPLVPIFMVLVGSAAAQKSQEQFVAMSLLSGRFLDLLRGMPTLKRLEASQQALETVIHSSNDYQQRTMGVLKLAFLSGAVLELFASLAIALVALYLGLGLLGMLPWAKGTIPVPYEGALFILLLAPEYYAPLRQLGNDYHAKAKAEAAVEEFYPILKAADELNRQNDIKDQTPLTVLNLKQAPSLEFVNLQIQTSEGRTRLLPTSFTVDTAQRIAIKGDSGSGKSSLLQALLGFVNYEGEILINQQIVNKASLANIRHKITYLSQSTSLLPLSIADNLRLAKSDASEKELIQVLKHVELWELISQLPKQLETQLGERGKGLSGGQQQRLCVAQLLLRESSLWLLDEPCSHLDPETAEQIYGLIEKFSKDKTLLLVSHDLSQLNWLDNIVTLHTDAKNEAQKNA